MNTLSEILGQGMALHQQGRLADAERIYREILRRTPDHFDALHMLGVIALQTGRKEEGVHLIAKAIALNGTVAAAHSNLGAGSRSLNRLEDAVESYQNAIALNPDDAEAHYNRATALQDLKRLEEAVAGYDKAIMLKPDRVEAHYNRGEALRELKRNEEAVAGYNAAIALRPDFAAAWCNRGIALQNLNRHEEAIASHDRAIELAPGSAEPYDNRGNALFALERHQEAIASHDKAIELRPDYAEAYNNRGNALRDLHRLEEAIANYDKAIALKPDFAEAYTNKGIALHDLLRHAEAIANHDLAIALKPDHAEAYLGKSSCLLRLGHYEQGLRLYEWRKKLHGRVRVRAFERPLWLGEDIAGKTLFVYWEQGFGDTIQFCRYVKLAEARGARVIMDVQSSLRRLLRSLSPTIQIIDRPEQPGEFDFHCPMPGLPLAFGTTLETIPAEKAYLRADEEARARWRDRLPPTPRTRIGVVWSGNPRFHDNPDRSIGLAALRPLIGGDADWICLQKEIRTEDSEMLRHYGDIAVFNSELHDFSDTAALVELMDLVLTVDTSVAHLAAALGKPVWLMLSFNPDWRWLLDRNDCPWYPTVRLFRQQKRGDWTGMLAQVANELGERRWPRS